MVPYGIVRGKVNGKIPVNIEDLSIFGFSFRMPELIQVESLDFICYQSCKDTYSSLTLTNFRLEIEEGPYAFYYHVELECNEYQALVKECMKEYKEYMDFKMQDIDLVDKQEMPNIPLIDFNQFHVIGLVLSDVETYLKDEHYLQQYPFKVDYLYIGSQTCIHLLPKVESINQIHDRKVVLMLPPIKTSEMEWIKHYLDQIKIDLEVVVNDIGTLILLQDYSFKITLGILMIKHSKDPRKKYLPYKMQADRINANELDYYHREFHVDRFSYECSEEEVVLNQSFDLYLPYYITNVATYCGIYAFEHNKSRYLGEKVEKCPRYCKKNNVVYDSKYQLFQKENCIKAFDNRSITDIEYLKKFHSGRIVINDENYGWNEFH